MNAFTKMEGLGNDFIVLEGPRDLDPKAVAALASRRWGIGADGVLVVWPNSDGPVQVVVFNADGSRAELSGNGLRCAARFAVDRGWGNPAGLVLETMAGSHRVERLAEDSYRVELGRVTTEGLREVGGRTVHSASIGNPHAVVLVPDPDRVELSMEGPPIAAEFTEGVNVGFLAVLEPDRFRLRVWERGVGETLACGTGAAAAHAVALDKGLSGPVATAVLDGGELGVERVDETTWLTGPAQNVYQGSWSPS